MKRKPLTTYTIADYPSDATDQRGFYMIQIADLIRQMRGIDQPHAHAFYLVMYVWAGSGTHTIDAQTYTVTPPQLYFLAPGQVHGWSLSNDAQGVLLFFDGAYFQARFPKRLFDYPFFRPDRPTALLSLRPDAPMLPTLFDWAYREFTHPRPRQAEVFASLLHLMLENAFQLYEEVAYVPAHNSSGLVRRFEELLDAQFANQRSCQAYADQLRVTPNYLNSCCRQQLDKTASQLIRDRLLAEADRLLLHTDLTIKAISYTLGFTDTAYFSRFYRKNNGQTPQQRRELPPDNH
ncbi:helix-turn-helix domain-containing protein [Spirosoma horti]|uniref:AraC family transcriptional regulator n=1 Tax=Spirosoma pollinicola TaxID=2057025 RepID=A0A2K8Z6F7_9BACT|nr:helix-turn-helix domain-containing protein [Spirosoma pollinicola]AUD05414.1 AraC family transcriptional regulator [Spirosoma pollinicola]RYF78233.1 MAG: helix-turn-helix domain-containing protein [Cytophagaceae bacterium]